MNEVLKLMKWWTKHELDDEGIHKNEGGIDINGVGMDV